MKKKFFKKDELRLLWPFYFRSLISTIFIISSIFYILYFKEIGFSLTQIGMLISSLALAQFLFEIPTGAIADLLGRKFSVVLGTFISGIVAISIMFFDNPYILIFLYFIWGMVETLISGADEAWIVDLLNSKKKKRLIHEFYTKKFSFMSIAGLISGIVGALLVKEFGLKIIWLASGSSLIFTSIILSFAQEHFVKAKRPIKKRIKELFSHTKKSVNYSVKHPIILTMLITGAISIIVGIFSGYLTWYPFLQELGFKDHWFGYLSSSIYVLGIFLPYFTKPLTKKLGSHKNYLAITLVVMSLLLFLTIFVKGIIFALLIYLLYRSAQNLHNPVRAVYFQKFLPKKMRATITSLRSMIIALTAIIALPLAGFVADTIGPQKTIFLGAFILIPAIILYSKINDKKS